MWKQGNRGCFITALVVKPDITLSRKGYARRVALKRLSLLAGIGVRPMTAKSGFSEFGENIFLYRSDKPHKSRT